MMDAAALLLKGNGPTCLANRTMFLIDTPVGISMGCPVRSSIKLLPSDRLYGVASEGGALLCRFTAPCALAGGRGAALTRAPRGLVRGTNRCPLTTISSTWGAFSCCVSDMFFFWARSPLPSTTFGGVACAAGATLSTFFPTSLVDGVAAASVVSSNPFRRISSHRCRWVTVAGAGG